MTDDYTPKLVDRSGGRIYAEMLVELETCPSCHLPMLEATPHGRPFPRYIGLDAKAQTERAGWRLRGTAYINGGYLCERCTAEGRARFVCVLCKQERTSGEIREMHGDPPEYLCTVCYETRTAKEWDEADEQLREKHRYDFD